MYTAIFMDKCETVRYSSIYLKCKAKKNLFKCNAITDLYNLLLEFY